MSGRKLPFRHECGQDFKSEADLKNFAIFEGIQPTIYPDKTDALMYTCKGCGSSFVMDAGRKYKSEEVKRSFALIKIAHKAKEEKNIIKVRNIEIKPTNLGLCRSCKNVILWGITVKNNKLFPISHDGKDMIAHFADCPDAKRFKKK